MGWSFIKMIKKGQFQPSQATGRVPYGFYKSQREYKRQRRVRDDARVTYLTIAVVGFIFLLTWALWH